MKSKFLTVMLTVSITAAIVSLLNLVAHLIPVEYLSYVSIGLLILLIGWLVYQGVDGMFDSYTPTMRSNLDTKEVEANWEWATILDELDPIKKEPTPEPKRKRRTKAEMEKANTTTRKAPTPSEPKTPKKRGPKSKK